MALANNHVYRSSFTPSHSPLSPSTSPPPHSPTPPPPLHPTWSPLLSLPLSHSPSPPLTPSLTPSCSLPPLCPPLSPPLALSPLSVPLSPVLHASLSLPYKTIRESFTKQCATILACYRKQCSSQSPAGQLILPESLKLLPMYANCILKSDCLLSRE